MRRPFTTHTAIAQGFTKSSLEWAVHQHRIQSVGHGVYVFGDRPVTQHENAAAVVVATGGVASGTFAGFLHGLDSITLKPPYVTVPIGSKRSNVRVSILGEDDISEVRGYRCTCGSRTVLDLAATLDDVVWEQALESALRNKLVTIEEIEDALTKRRVGNSRIRRVLKLRPKDVPPTESLLETLMVQLIRTDEHLPTPTRQVEVRNGYDEFVARVDLAWPEHGVFLELDGEQHKDQPVYDANRQTRVVAATGWLVGRFTWKDVTRNQRTTLRRLGELLNVTRATRAA